MRWTPLHCHSHYSLLDGISKPEQIAARCNKLGYSACAITDHGNIGVMVDFWGALKPKKIKPIAGCEFYLCEHDPWIRPTADNGYINGRPYAHLVVLAKNLEGWKQLISATSYSNRKEHIYYQPRLSLESFRQFTQCGNLIAFSGHPGSDLANIIFKDPKAAYGCRDYAEVIAEHIYEQTEVKKRLIRKAEQYISVFGKDNFFLEIQVLNPDGMPACRAIATALRWLSKRLGIPCMATADSHYVEKRDASDQRVVLCANMGTTLATVQRKLDLNEDVALAGFWSGDHYHIPSIEEMAVHHTEQELEHASVVSDMCEEYDITRQPMLPHFPCPDGMNADTYLRELCQQGWERKIEGRIPDYKIEEYRQRVEMELNIFTGAGLSGYFLIVQDFINYGYSQNWLMGGIRGSGAGCMVSYLLNISDIDPILYDLMFERFYNAGRNAPGRVSLPDIDSDIPKYKADELYAYLQRKYGHDHVAKIATFHSMQGRSALSQVLAVHGVDYDEIKRVTQIIPAPQTITEELENIREGFTEEEKAAGKEPSIIDYALDLYPEEFSEWVHRLDDGSLDGNFAPYFAQAIRLEGTKKNISQHAAGVIITPEPVASLFPLAYDKKEDSYFAAMQYERLEKMGACKFDILSVAFLDKADGVRKLCLTGRIDEDD